MGRGTFSVRPGDLAEEGCAALTPREVRSLLFSPALFRHLRRYDEVDWLTHDVRTAARPFLTNLAMTALGRRGRLRDVNGSAAETGMTAVAASGLRFARDLAAAPGLLRGASAAVRALRPVHLRPVRAMARNTPLYLRTDLTPGLAAGGSVAHMAGVLNNLMPLAGRPVFLTAQPIPTVSSEVETYVVPPPDRYWDLVELPQVAYNEVLLGALTSALRGREPGFVYARYGRFGYAPAAAADRLGRPLALEYNGSEVWIADAWGTPIRHRALAVEVEDAVLAAADLVVVVSAAMRDELVGRGFDERRVLVNPNGVDTDLYSPGVDGAPVRRRLGVESRLVLGFIGTFGAWHGAEVVPVAVADLFRRRPELRSRVAVVMVGDGPRMALVRQLVSEHGLDKSFRFTGLVPQLEGPAHLAAADVLLSPHVQNADGTPFFGSPTKLFEYMAMGRAIVASDLDQIGEVLDHDRNAWLVAPGDPAALSAGIERLIDDADRRARLGTAARADAVARHTWRAHTARIVDRLEELTR